MDTTLKILSVSVLIFTIVYQTQADVTSPSRQYPLTVGGFDGQSQIFRFNFDSSDNLVMAGCSYEGALLGGTSSTICTLIVLYATTSGAPYLWANYYPSIFVSTIYNIAFSPDNTRILLTISYGSDITLMILNSNSGQVYMTLQQQQTTTATMDMNIGANAFFYSKTLISFCSYLQTNANQNTIAFGQFDISTPSNYLTPSITGFKYANTSEAYSYLRYTQGASQNYATVTVNNAGSMIMGVQLVPTQLNFILMIQDEIYIDRFCVYSHPNPSGVIVDQAVFGFATMSICCNAQFSLFLANLPGLSISNYQKVIGGQQTFEYYTCLDMSADSPSSVYILSQGTFYYGIYLFHATFSGPSVTMVLTSLYNIGGYMISQGMIKNTATQSYFIAGSQSAIYSFNKYGNLGYLQELSPLATDSIVTVSSFSVIATSTLLVKWKSKLLNYNLQYTQLGIHSPMDPIDFFFCSSFINYCSEYDIPESNQSPKLPHLSNSCCQFSICILLQHHSLKSISIPSQFFSQHGYATMQWKLRTQVYIYLRFNQQSSIPPYLRFIHQLNYNI